MFEDILGSKKKKKKKIEEDKDSIIESLKYNLREKGKMIEDLVKQVTELERQLESKENETYVGIG